jgi:nitrogen fixation NifU-like protein
MNIYGEKLLDHYSNPRNYGVLEMADSTNELENISCGDSIKVSVKLANGVIDDIKFTGEGCAVAIGTASMLMEYAKGKSIKEMMKFSLEDLLDLTGIELTMSRLKCANLSLETLHNALQHIDRK